MNTERLRCPSCGAASLTVMARMRVGRMRCDACGTNLRIAKSTGLKITASVVGQLLLVWFVYLGIVNWNWWPALGLLVISVISPFAVAIFGRVESVESQS